MTKAEEIFYKHLNSEDVKHIADKSFLMDRLLDAINEALSQHDVSGMLKSFVSYAESRSISDININDDTIEYFIEDFNLH